MTAAEEILWEHLRGNRLEGLHFRRQQVIDGYITDFYCHAARLVLEVDGKIHESQVEADLYRESVLKRRGFKILRVKNEEVKTDLQGILERILIACGK